MLPINEPISLWPRGCSSASDWRIVQKLKLPNSDLCQKQVASCHLNKSDIRKSSGCPSLFQSAFWWRQMQWEQSPIEDNGFAPLGALSQYSVASNPMSRLVQTVMPESIKPSAVVVTIVERAMPQAVNKKLICDIEILRFFRQVHWSTNLSV